MTVPAWLRSRYVAFAVKALLTALIFWLLAREVDGAYVRTMLENQDHGMIAAVVLAMFGQIGLGAVRWHIIMRSLAHAGENTLSFPAAARVFYIGVFFSSCLPGTVGADVARVVLAKAQHIRLPLLIQSVIIDRMMALSALILIVLAMLPYMGAAAADMSPWAVLALLACAIAAGLWVLFRIEAWLAPLSHWRVVHAVRYFAGSLKLIVQKPLLLAFTLVISMASHVVSCIGVWALAQSLGIDMTIVQSVALVSPVILAMVIPVSIGGWGVREAGLVGMLALIGVPQAAALMLSVQIGLLGILTSLPAGLLWLASRKQSLTKEQAA